MILAQPSLSGSIAPPQRLSDMELDPNPIRSRRLPPQESGVHESESSLNINLNVQVPIQSSANCSSAPCHSPVVDLTMVGEELKLLSWHEYLPPRYSSIHRENVHLTDCTDKDRHVSLILPNLVAISLSPEYYAKYLPSMLLGGRFRVAICKGDLHQMRGDAKWVGGWIVLYLMTERIVC